MRIPTLTAGLLLASSILARGATAQGCYMVRDLDTVAVVTNPLTTVEFRYGQYVYIHWRAGTTTRRIDVYPGFPTKGFLCPGSAFENDFNFNDRPSQGIQYQWWTSAAKKPVFSGNPQDPAARAYLVSTLALPVIPRNDRPVEGSTVPRTIPYHRLAYEALTGDTVRVGTTIRVFDAKDEVLISMSWTLARAPAKAIAAAPPKPADPCAGEDERFALPDGPTMQSAGASGTTGSAARVEPPTRTPRQRLVTALACYADAKAMLRAFFPNGTLTTGVSDLLAERALRIVAPRGATSAEQHTQIVTLHEQLLADADAVKTVRELFGERAPVGAPLVKIEGEALSGSFRNATWTEALRRFDRHLTTRAADAQAEARTEATLYLFSHRGEWTNIRIAMTLAAFAPPLVASATMIAAPLYDDLPAITAPPRPLDESAPEFVDFALDKSRQILGLLGHLGVPGAGDPALSPGRIRSGVRIATGKGTPLDILREALDALPQDDAVMAAKGNLFQLTRAFNQLSAVAGEPDRIISNARFEVAFDHFANRTASVPSIQGWIGAANDEARRTSNEMVAHRDTIGDLRATSAQRFGRPFERMVVECTPNLECFNTFREFKVRIEEQQYRIAHLIDERAANLVEQRALCWRLAQRGGANGTCTAIAAPRKGFTP